MRYFHLFVPCLFVGIFRRAGEGLPDLQSLLGGVKSAGNTKRPHESAKLAIGELYELVRNCAVESASALNVGGGEYAIGKPHN